MAIRWQIASTGETSTGRLIMQYASQNIIPVTLELGGKSPDIFFADVMDQDDSYFDKALEGFAMFALNQGEVCTCAAQPDALGAVSALKAPAPDAGVPKKPPNVAYLFIIIIKSKSTGHSGLGGSLFVATSRWSSRRLASQFISEGVSAT
jgi:hypothetical protein